MREELCLEERDSQKGSQNFTEGIINFVFEQCFGSPSESNNDNGAHKWLFGTVIFLMYVDAQDKLSAADFSTFFPVVNSYDLA